MKNFKGANYFWKILWFIGAIVLVKVSLDIRNELERIAMESLESAIPMMWVRSLIPFIFGLYLALLIVKKWKVRINLSLLACVSIPSILLAFGMPLWVSTPFGYYINNFLGRSVLFWLIEYADLGVFGVIGGVTFVLSFFHTTPNKK